MKAIDVVFRRTAELLDHVERHPADDLLGSPERTAEVWAMLEEVAAFDSYEEAVAFAATQRHVYEECASK